MSYTKRPALGQAAMAASEPVVIANNQSAVPVSFTGSTDAATQTTLAALNAKLVTGTVIGDVNLGATDNAVLDTIAAKDFATQTTLATLNAKLVTGTDIGDVTINNSTGAAAVNIQDGGNTITVDGTVAVTNAGITTIAGAVAGTEMQCDVLTMPTITVNSHAVTNAGTFAVQVDGNALTSLQLIDDTVYTDGSGTPSKGILVLGSDGTNPQAIITDATGHLQVDVLTAPTITVNSHAVTNAGTFAVQATLAAETTKVIGTVNVAAAQTIAVTNADITSCKTALELLDNSVDGNYLNTNLNYAGTDAATGNGTAAGSLRVSLASDSTGIVSLTTSTASIGKLAANSGVDIGDVDILSIAAGDNNIGNVDIITLPGSSELIFRSIDLDETEEEVKATAALLYGWYIFNAAAATQYVKLYNATAANVTVGTTTPVMTIPVPAGAAANVEFTNGIAFATALTAAATTGVADADTGAPAANSVVINILYK